MSVADELRAVIREFYLPGTPEGKLLEAIAVKVEALEAQCPRCGEADLVNEAGCSRCGWQGQAKP